MKFTYAPYQVLGLKVALSGDCVLGRTTVQAQTIKAYEAKSGQVEKPASAIDEQDTMKRRKGHK